MDSRADHIEHDQLLRAKMPRIPLVIPKPEFLLSFRDQPQPSLAKQVAVAPAFFNLEQDAAGPAACAILGTTGRTVSRSLRGRRSLGMSRVPKPDVRGSRAAAAAGSRLEFPSDPVAFKNRLGDQARRVAVASLIDRLDVVLLPFVLARRQLPPKMPSFGTRPVTSTSVVI